MITPQEQLLRRIFGEPGSDEEMSKPEPIVHAALPHHMTVGDLRRRLLDLPDDTPVCYCCIEDSSFEPGTGWLENSVRVNPANTYDSSAIGDYVQAWSAFVLLDKDGKPGLYITAHY